MIQDDQERQDKLYKMIQKVSKDIEAQKAKKNSEIKKQNLKQKSVRLFKNNAQICQMKFG